jgi:hypothetical protein
MSRMKSSSSFVSRSRASTMESPPPTIASPPPPPPPPLPPPVMSCKREAGRMRDWQVKLGVREVSVCGRVEAQKGGKGREGRFNAP